MSTAASFSKRPSNYYRGGFKGSSRNNNVYKKTRPIATSGPYSIKSAIIREDMEKPEEGRCFEPVVEDEFWSSAEREEKLRDLSKTLNLIYTVLDNKLDSIAIPANSHIDYQLRNGDKLCVFQPPILNPNEFIILEHYVSKDFSKKLKTYTLSFEDFDQEIPRLAKLAIVAPYILYSIFKNLRDYDPTFKNYNLFNDIRYEIFKTAAKNILSDELIERIHREYFPVIRDASYNREEVIARFIRDLMYYVDTGKLVDRVFENTPESNYYNKDYKFVNNNEENVFKLINYLQLIKVYVFYIVLVPDTCYGHIYV